MTASLRESEAVYGMNLLSPEMGLFVGILPPEVPKHLA